MCQRVTIFQRATSSSKGTSGTTARQQNNLMASDSVDGAAAILPKATYTSSRQRAWTICLLVTEDMFGKNETSHAYDIAFPFYFYLCMGGYNIIAPAGFLPKMSWSLRWHTLCSTMISRWRKTHPGQRILDLTKCRFRTRRRRLWSEDAPELHRQENDSSRGVKTAGEGDFFIISYIF